MNQPPLRKIDLRAQQIAAYEFAYNRPATLIAMGMGAGKSATATALMDNWECCLTMIVCPTTVRNVWRGQLEKHAARDYAVAILDKGSVARRTQLANRTARRWLKRPPPCVVVVNYEAIWREPFKSWAMRQKWDLIVLDESQRAMGETNVALMCNELRRVSRRRLCLSGTPMTQTPTSIWAQARFLDPNVFGQHLQGFEARYLNPYMVGCRKAIKAFNEYWRPVYASMGKEWHDWVIPSFLHGTLNTENYLKRLGTIAFRGDQMKIDMPPLTRERRTFALSPQARELYLAIQNGYIDEIETGRWPDVNGSYAITMRLQQITSGFLPDREGKVVEVDGGKAACLLDLLSAAAGEPVVVFARFVRDLDTVQSQAKQLGLVYGEISQRRKDGVNNKGTMPDGLQVVGVQEKAGGVGIDLTRARIAIFYSISWSVADFDQALARVYRPPQDKPVIVYELLAEDSIDGELYRALDARRENVGDVWKGLSSPAPALAAGTGCCRSNDTPIPS
jgi:SNF2 family DNA or RNA helicase